MLVIKGKKYDISNLYTLPGELNGFNITSKQDDNALEFFGEQNPFSNFHPAKFAFNGMHYHCSEQLMQHSKAKFFSDHSTALKIMDCTDALECKRIFKDITKL